eukprot:3777376-Rhodomonas_salina.1
MVEAWRVCAQAMGAALEGQIFVEVGWTGCFGEAWAVLGREALRWEKELEEEEEMEVGEDRREEEKLADEMDVVVHQ